MGMIAWARVVVCTLVSALCTFGIPAQPISTNKLVEVGDPIIQKLRNAYDLAGLILPMEVQPVPVFRILSLLDRLEAEAGIAQEMSDLAVTILGVDTENQLKSHLAIIIQEIRLDLHGRSVFANPDLKLDFELTLSPEVYLQTRAQSDAGGLERITGYKQRNPLLSLSTELVFGPVWGLLDVELKEDHTVTDYLRDPADWSNLPEQATYIDYQFPFRAVVNTGGELWQFALGRDRLELGNGKRGNLGISDSPDFFDFARLQLGAGYLHYTVQWLSFEPWLDGFSSPLAPPASAIIDLQKNAFIHRWDFSFWDKVHLALTEGIMVGGIEPSLKFFNPLIVFHNLFPWLDVGGMMGASSFLGLEVSAQPLRWLRLWYQYGMNQVQSQFERETYPDVAGLLPDSYGWLAGFEFTLPLLTPQSTEAWVLELGLEFVFTNPWFYVRENALNSWFWRRRLASNVGDVRMIDRPIGWKYGPDSQSFYVWVALEDSRSLDLVLSFEHRVQGEKTILSPYEESLQAASLTTPSGIPEYTQFLGLELDFVLVERPRALIDHAPIYLPPELGFDLGLWLVARQNQGHFVNPIHDWVDLQVSASVRLVF